MLALHGVLQECIMYYYVVLLVLFACLYCKIPLIESSEIQNRMQMPEQGIQKIYIYIMSPGFPAPAASLKRFDMMFNNSTAADKQARFRPFRRRPRGRPQHLAIFLASSHGTAQVYR